MMPPSLRLCLAAFLALLGLPALAQDGYHLRPGDVLRIEVVEDAGLNRSALVAPDGRISIPLAGSLPAAGRSVDQVQADLAARLRPSFAAAPTVFVSLEQLAQRPPAAAPAPGKTIAIYVVGEAGRTGRIEVAPGTTLMQAFSEMGGFTPFAARKRVQLQRGADRQVVNYVAIEAGRSAAGSTPMADGDVIVVPQRRLFE